MYTFSHRINCLSSSADPSGVNRLEHFTLIPGLNLHQSKGYRPIEGCQRTSCLRYGSNNLIMGDKMAAKPTPWCLLTRYECLSFSLSAKAPSAWLFVTGTHAHLASIPRCVWIIPRVSVFIPGGRPLLARPTRDGHLVVSSVAGGGLGTQTQQVNRPNKGSSSRLQRRHVGGLMLGMRFTWPTILCTLVWWVIMLWLSYLNLWLHTSYYTFEKKGFYRCFWI